MQGLLFYPRKISGNDKKKTKEPVWMWIDASSFHARCTPAAEKMLP